MIAPVDLSTVFNLDLHALAGIMPHLLVFAVTPAMAMIQSKCLMTIEIMCLMKCTYLGWGSKKN